MRPDYPDTPRMPLLKFVPPTAERILDIGCAKGAFGATIKSQRPNVEVWGVEPDAEAATIAAGRLDRVLNDFFTDALALPQSYFDLVTFNDSLEHMPDPESALRYSMKLLSTGGRIHCCVPNMRQIDNLEHLLINKDWQYEEIGIRDRTHLRFFTRKSIEDLFISLGFKIVSIEGINESWWDTGKPFRRLLFKIFRQYTSDMRHTQFLVIAELP